ncbi:MAG: TonB-dependent receptor [Proteobacteria bacterium]|nr:TonB-dependent receptor [Pseudomonadota bacterium]
MTSWIVPAMARVGFDRGAHHVALSLVGHVAQTERDLALATTPAARVDQRTLTGDAIATWRGRWTHTRASAQLAWHHSGRVETATDPAAADRPQLLTAYIPAALPDDPALVDACVDVDPDKFRHCPVPSGFFASGGAGLLVDQIADRPTISADVAHQLGDHVLRAGATFEDIRLITRSSYTGGELQRSLFDGHLDRARFHGTGTCFEIYDQPCDTLAVSELNFRTRYTAAYAEDTFHPTPDIAVDGGLRWELMWIGPAVHFSHELSPRLGMSWDVLGDGRSRVWASLGRSFAYLPAGIGDLVLPGNRRVRDITIEGIGATRTLETGAPVRVDPALAPPTSDEITAGVELGLARTVRLVGWAAIRRLRAMETVDTTLTNPDDGHETAVRHTTTVAAELATTGKLALRFGYLYTRAVGSTTGMFDPRQGATFYGGADFDTTTTNLFGRLPTDLSHRVFVEARRAGHLAGLPVAASLRLAANSGRPRDALSVSGAGTAFLVPRGSFGRNPILGQANAELTARWQGLDVSLDVFNVFDKRAATAIDDVYTVDAVAPIDHGTAQDLVFARTASGRSPRRSTNFQYGTVFQAPVAATLGIRRAF